MWLGSQQICVPPGQCNWRGARQRDLSAEGLCESSCPTPHQQARALGPSLSPSLLMICKSLSLSELQLSHLPSFQILDHMKPS